MAGEDLIKRCIKGGESSPRAAPSPASNEVFCSGWFIDHQLTTMVYLTKHMSIINEFPPIFL
jgi:hypothetical protein